MYSALVAAHVVEKVDLLEALARLQELVHSRTGVDRASHVLQGDGLERGLACEGCCTCPDTLFPESIVAQVEPCELARGESLAKDPEGIKGLLLLQNVRW